jgi:hypothetical protein
MISHRLHRPARQSFLLPILVAGVAAVIPNLSAYAQADSLTAAECTTLINKAKDDKLRQAMTQVERAKTVRCLALLKDASASPPKSSPQTPLKIFRNPTGT